MNAEAFRDARDNTPFIPFTMHLADGRKYRVSHPELILIPRGNPRIIAMSGSDGRIHVIDVLLVIELELEEGRRRRAG
jgi:hypothetical protein